MALLLVARAGVVTVLVLVAQLTTVVVALALYGRPWLLFWRLWMRGGGPGCCTLAVVLATMVVVVALTIFSAALAVVFAATAMACVVVALAVVLVYW